MMEKTRETKSLITLRRFCVAAAVLLVFALVLVAPAAAEGDVAFIGETGYATLENAVAAVETMSSTTTTIDIVAGTHILPNSGVYANKKIIFNGTEEGVIFDATGLGNEVYADELTFKNVAINFPDTSHKGITHTNKVVFEDCTFSGTQTLYATVVEFNNCVFTGNQGKDMYYVWTYGSTDVTFTNCVFNTGGKAILVYHESEKHATIKLNNCVFNDDDSSTNDNDGQTQLTKAAVEVGSSDNSNDTTYKIIINNCTVNGFTINPAGTSTGSTLWGNKNSMDNDHLSVVEVKMESITNSVYDGQPYDGTVTFTTHYGKDTFVPNTYEWYEKDNDVPLTGVPKDAGEYQLKVTATEVSGYAPFGVKDVSIEQATITVTLKDSTKELGSADVFNYESSGHFEEPGFIGTPDRVAGENSGSYPISRGTLELDNNAASGFKVSNYKLDFSSTPAYLTITPELVLRGDDVPPTSALTAGQVSQDAQDAFNIKISDSYADKFSEKHFIEVSLVNAQGQPDSTTRITFIVPYQTLGISAAEAGEYEFVVLHLLNGVNIETIPTELAPEGLKIGPTTTSPFAIGYSSQTSGGSTSGSGGTGGNTGGNNGGNNSGDSGNNSGNNGNNSDSSTPQGSSVWLTEPLTPTPTETAQPTPSDTVPTDLPTTQPTPTETETPGFGVLAVLAGLGAVAALRRK